MVTAGVSAIGFRASLLAVSRNPRRVDFVCVLIAACWAAACQRSDGDMPDGALGGKCYRNGTCNEGLVCDPAVNRCALGDGCLNVTCSDHGACGLALDGSAVCSCAEGYRPEGLACVLGCDATPNLTWKCDGGDLVWYDGCGRRGEVKESCGPGGCTESGECISPNTCGNGTVDEGEECDDGDLLDTDLCPSTCRWARCGDGFVRARVEECDDQNADEQDGCTSTCVRCDQGNAQFVWTRDAGGNGNCYFRVDANQTRGDASSSCASAGGNLLTITSALEQAAVVTALGGAPFWMGLNDCGRTDDSFVYSTGETSLYANWAAGEPATTDGSHCGVQVRADGTWDESWHDAGLAYVCEKSATPWSIEPTSRHAYRRLWWDTTWAAAEGQCVAWGGHIAAIGSLTEQVYLAARFGCVWLGASDITTEGTFTWVTGEAWAYTNFMQNQPDNTGTNAAGLGDCVTMGCNNQAGAWDDDICTATRGILCELE